MSKAMDTDDMPELISDNEEKIINQQGKSSRSRIHPHKSPTANNFQNITSIIYTLKQHIGIANDSAEPEAIISILRRLLLF